MKTPREILLARHRDAKPKLDVMRRQIVDGLNPQALNAASQLHFSGSWLDVGFKAIWRELVWPCRRVWTGLAAVWILLIVFNIASRSDPQLASPRSATTTAMISSFRDQQKMLNELFSERALPGEAEQRRIFSPKPRTEKFQFSIV